MVRLHGTDVSSWQPEWTPPNEDAFVFVKASESTTYTNPLHDKHVALARKAGLVVGHYHYMAPGNATAQAAYFVAQAKPAPGDILVCDWEGDWSKGAHPSVEDAAAFIAEVRRLKPQHRVLLYCNRSDWMTTAVKAPMGLWIAEYGVAKPNILHDWIFWQYTDKPLDQNWCKFEVKAELVKWARGLIPLPPPPKPKTVADATVTLATEVPVKAWGDVDMIQAFDVYLGTLAALQTQKAGSREDARVRWHSIALVAGKVIVKYLRTDMMRGAGHPQTLNLNSKINVPWAGRKATFRAGAPRRNLLGSKALPVASWPKNATATRTATGAAETYTFKSGQTARKATVPKFGGTFQGATATAGGIWRINGSTVDSGTSHKITVTQFDWAGRAVGVKDLTYLLRELDVTSIEPEGISYCQLPGDTRPYLYAGLRTGSVAKRRYLIYRLTF